MQHVLIIAFFLCSYSKFEKKNAEHFLCNVLDYTITTSNGNEIPKSHHFINGLVDVIIKTVGL